VDDGQSIARGATRHHAIEREKIGLWQFQFLRQH
jgi:hypothetical protein